MRGRAHCRLQRVMRSGTMCRTSSEEEKMRRFQREQTTERRRTAEEAIRRVTERRPERTRLRQRLKRRWENQILVDLKWTGCKMCERGGV